MLDPETPAADGSDTLAVLLHAYTHTAKDMESVWKAVSKVWPKAEPLIPELSLCLFAMADPDLKVLRLLKTIDDRVDARKEAGNPVRRIVLIGHSVGALLARKLYVVACGETDRAPFEPVYREALGEPVPPREWAHLVERIVLLAGMNRGWRLSHHISLTHYPLWLLGSAVGRIIHLFTRRWPLIFRVRRGAEFITALRIQWIAMRQRVGKNPCLDTQDGATGGEFESVPPEPPLRPDDQACILAGKALTVQLLGSVDDMVSPDDNVDLVAGSDFVYLDVPYSGHADVIRMDDPEPAGPSRREALTAALTESKDALKARAVIPVDENDAYPEPDPRMRHVVFVIHGIRDEGYWTHKIARRVKERARQRQAPGKTALQWATETSSYGYFPMLPFVFYGARRSRVEWLMDRYAEALARYPCARFSYVGHSNGTYLLAEALELYPGCRFEHVVLAGSVISQRYDWTRFTKARSASTSQDGSPLRPAEPRVKAVLNLVATADWVVAWFPKGIQQLGFWSSELGSLGHDGFRDKGEGMYETKYIRGGHSAAITEDMWDMVADFVLRGAESNTQAPAHKVLGPGSPKSGWARVVRGLGLFPPLVWGIIATLLYGGWLVIELALSATLSCHWLDYGRGAATALYALLIWLGVTRI